MSAATRIYHGWWIVAAGFVCTLLAIGGTNYSFGLFVAPLSEEFGLSRADDRGAEHATAGVDSEQRRDADLGVDHGLDVGHGDVLVIRFELEALRGKSRYRTAVLVYYLRDQPHLRVTAGVDAADADLQFAVSRGG